MWGASLGRDVSCEEGDAYQEAFDATPTTLVKSEWSGEPWGYQE